MIKLFFILLITFSFNSNAAWFGPKTYEECMNDGKVGRTNAELNELRKYCSSKFKKKSDIKLINLFTKGNSNLRCVVDGNAYDFYISQRTIRYENINYEILLNDEKNIIFKLEKFAEVHDKKLNDWYVALKNAKNARDNSAVEEIQSYINQHATYVDALFTVFNTGKIHMEIRGNSATSNINNFFSGECVEK